MFLRIDLDYASMLKPCARILGRCIGNEVVEEVKHDGMIDEAAQDGALKAGAKTEAKGVPLYASTLPPWRTIVGCRTHVLPLKPQAC
jgi:hypothetical protein